MTQPTVRWAPPPAYSMTEAQAWEVVTLMALNWPHPAVTKEAFTRLWMPRLAQMDFSAALEAAEIEIGPDGRGEFMPRAGQFVETYRGVMRRRRDATPAVPESTAPPASAEYAKAQIAGIRDVLSRSRGPLARDLKNTISGVEDRTVAEKRV